MWKNYFKIGLRNLIKNKAYTSINLFGLTVGVAASILLFFYIQHQLSVDKFHEYKDSVFRVLRTFKDGEEVKLSPSLPLALKPVLESNFAGEMVYTNILPNNFLVKTEEGDGFRQEVTMVSPAFFEMFTFRMLQGTYPKNSEGRSEVVLAEETAKRYFGESDPIGKDLLIRLAEDFITFKVIGIIENKPRNSSLGYEVLILDDNVDVLYTPQQIEHWHMAFGDAYLMVKEKTNSGDFESVMTAYMQRLFSDREDPIDYNFSLQPLEDIYLNTEIGPGSAANLNPKILWVLSGIGVLIILIACINFTTMSIGNSASRAREVGVRKTMGADKSQLFGQFMSESVILTLAALVLGGVLATLLLPVFNQWMATEMLINFSWEQIGVIVGLGIVIALLAGSYPSIFLASFLPIQVLKSNLNLKFGKQNLRMTLLGFQFFISIFLITCTIIMHRQMRTIEDHELGIHHQSIVQVNVPPPASHGLADFINKGFDYGQTFKNELLKFPEVEKVSIATGIYGDNSWFQAGYETPEDQEINFSINIVDEDFVEVFGLEIIEGRNFSANILSDKKGGFLLNESMKNALGWNSVLDNSMESKRGFPDNRAVGLLKDFHFESLYKPITPGILVLSHENIFSGLHSLMMSDDLTPKIFVKVQTSELQETIGKMEDTWRGLYGSDPFDYSFLDDTIARQYAKDQSLRSLVTASSLIAIIIAGMGLFAMASLAISTRIKEIGIRKVLGASAMEISILFNKEFLKITIIGILMALPLSYFLMKEWLNEFAVRTQLGAGTFLFATALGLTFSILIVSLQTINASGMNPVNNLKSD
ncbi:ABC transporter permease [Shivajiella indica]|uniref:ABC transporter permease n=1 Tax=Shivajiella indica TaxID=872115 RepID=A0ABW5B800_9BACT